MNRAVAALKWTLLMVVTIALTFGYLWTADRLGFGRVGRWVLLIGMISTAVALFVMLIRADLRAEDERWDDKPDRGA